jgi:hypothetical protein
LGGGRLVAVIFIPMISKELIDRLGHSTAEMALRNQRASEDRDLELARKRSVPATRG